jgi:hypothetical protein
VSRIAIGGIGVNEWSDKEGIRDEVIGNRGFVRQVIYDLVSVDFPTGKFPIRARNTWVNIHRGSGICETRSCEFRTRDHARSDFPIGQREIIRRVLWV